MNVRVPHRWCQKGYICDFPNEESSLISYVFGKGALVISL